MKPSEALEELKIMTVCRCDEVYTGRGRHDPHCICGYADEVKIVADYVAELEERLATIHRVAQEAIKTHDQPHYGGVDTAMDHSADAIDLLRTALATSVRGLSWSYENDGREAVGQLEDEVSGWGSGLYVTYRIGSWAGRYVLDYPDKPSVHFDTRQGAVDAAQSDCAKRVVEAFDLDAVMRVLGEFAILPAALADLKGGAE